MQNKEVKREKSDFSKLEEVYKFPFMPSQL